MKSLQRIVSRKMMLLNTLINHKKYVEYDHKRLYM